MYNGDGNLRGAGENVEIDQHRMEEIIRCKEDIIYFAENYFNIITIDEGKQLIQLRDYQKKMLKAFIEPTNGARNVVVCSCRQSGKCFFKDSKINIRNKKTGKVEEISILDFYDRVK
jgi:hypothetical protein